MNYKHCWLGVGIVSAVGFMGHPYRQGGEVRHWTFTLPGHWPFLEEDHF